MARKLTAQTIKGVAFNDTQLVIKVAAITLECIGNDALGTLVTLDAVASEDLDIDHCTRHARRYAQRRVLHVASLLTEDDAQKLLFRSQLRFTLRRHLTDEHITGFNFSADKHDAGIIQTGDWLLKIRNVASDLFGPSFVSRDTTESSSM